jgi:hypothetical protein
MQAWWDSSPYWITSLYLPGSPNHRKDPNLNAAWVNAIQNQGWGLIPIWFGLQASCALNNQGTPFASVISTDPATARTQGMKEADLALSSILTNGFLPDGPTIVYHDIENYTPAPSSQCSLAVIAFLSGWVTGLHAHNILAGVYGNQGPMRVDFSQVSPLPDDAWIAAYNKKVTIWGLLGASDGTLWRNDKRIHQYQQPCC